MKVQRLLQINMAALVSLGTLLLGMGQRSGWLATVVIVAAATSVYFTDILEQFQLSRRAANILAVVAVAIFVHDFLPDDRSNYLPAIANLLIYLQIIHLYRKKTIRIYWQLATLSLLQVVVAAVVSAGFEFGPLLVIYMFVALSALCLFFLYRETASYAPRDLAVTYGDWQWPMTAPPAPPSGRMTDHPSDGALGWAVIWQIVKMGLASIAFTMAVFFAVPRVGSMLWQDSETDSQQVVGFSTEISLNEIGDIIKSDQSVMRVHFIDHGKGNTYELRQEPYFRGATLTNYSPKGGSADWKMARRDRGSRLQPGRSIKDLVRLEIVLEPDRKRALFGMFPVFQVDETTNPVRVERRTGQLFFSDRARPKSSEPFRYVLGTTGFEDGWHRQITPLAKGQQPRSLDALKEWDPDKLPELKRIADSIIDDAMLSDDEVDQGVEPRFRRAQALEAHFRYNSRYTYSLQAASRQNRSPGNPIDPTEDFIANHRTGHCEYFASALALMLRSQDIPARIVVGYRGGEFNSVGEFYQVKRLDAHAWVEAYLEPKHIPASLLREDEPRDVGAWVRLDPTPGTDQSSADQALSGAFARLIELFEYAQVLWTDYVLELNWDRQKKDIYDPLYVELSLLIRDLLSWEVWSHLPIGIARTLGIDIYGRASGRWFSWRAGLTAMFVCLVFVGVFRLVRPPIGRLIAWIANHRPVPKSRRSLRIEFYRRLEMVLARHGMKRAATQTQREFALEAAGQLTESPSCRHAASMPRRVVEAFYRVRFGGHALDKHEAEAVEHALTRLEEALSADAQNAAGNGG